MAATVAQTLDWPSLRAAYVDREVKPTLEELAEEFGGTISRISSVSIADGWGIARASRIEKRLAQAETGQMILAALAGDKTLIDSAKTAALTILREIAELADTVDKNKANATRAAVLQNLSYGFLNVTAGLKNVGIAGLTKTLEREGKEANGQWNPQMLSQINLTVQNLVSQAEGATAAAKGEAKPAVDAEVGPAAEKPA